MLSLSEPEPLEPRNFPVLRSVLETYSRHVKVGDSEGWCGANYIVMLVRPFTPGENAVMTWVRAQDEASLVDSLSLGDGRDYIILKRHYTKQTYTDALNEQAVFSHDFIRPQAT